MQTKVQTHKFTFSILCNSINLLFYYFCKLLNLHMSSKKLLFDQLNSKMRAFGQPMRVSPPPTGWVRATRTALGMSLEQLGKRLGMSRQGVRTIEIREAEGAITLKSLREAAQALDMDLVYGFLPKDGTLDALVERKAQELATRIVARTSNTMKLEDQENSMMRLKKAIAERTAMLKHEMPKVLWD
jgi:predicted DNA-binding mobile mystery protein A